MNGQKTHGEKRRLIMITNDDGIEASGLYRLAKAALDFGEVWIVAPERQRSAASHSISLRDPIDVYPYDYPLDNVRAFSCVGTPCDCVRVGVRAVLPKKPDVVLCGMNHGYNTGTDIQYSATVGAAFEAAFQGCGAIAFSEEYVSCGETADFYLKSILEELIDERPGPGRVMNVNFPGCPLSECRGVLRNRTVSSEPVYNDLYKLIKELPGGGRRFEVDGTELFRAEDGSDLRAVYDKYVSIGAVRNIS